MTNHAEKIDGQWVEKTPAQFRKEREASIPDAALEDAGLFEVTDDPRPNAPGQRVTPGPLVDRDGRPYRTWAVRDYTVEELATIRAGMILDRTDFGEALFDAEIISAEEYLVWASGGVPASVENDFQLAGLSGAALVKARARVMAAQTVGRTNDLVGLLQQTRRLTDAKIDALFGGLP